MAAVLAVVRPHMNGVGGDAFVVFALDARGSVSAAHIDGFGEVRRFAAERGTAAGAAGGS